MRALARIVLLFLSVVILSGPAVAQSNLTVGRDQAGWDRTSALAVAWLKSDPEQRERIALDRWQDLRLTLTVERELALQRSEAGTLDAKLLRAQIAALEPVKKEPEEPWAVQRRTSLEAALGQAEAPLVAARDTYARDSVLIAEIDRIVIRLERAQLIARRPSIVEPAFWRSLSSEASVQRVSAATVALLPHPSGSNLLLVIGLSLSAVLAAIFAHRWVFTLAQRGRQTPRRSLAAALAKDLADIALPMLVLLAVLALLGLLWKQPSLPDDISTEIISAGAIAIYCHWLGRSAFQPFFAPGRVFAASADTARHALAVTTILGVILAAESLLEVFDTLRPAPAAMSTLASVVVIMAASYLLWRLTRILDQDESDAAGEQRLVDGARSGLTVPLPLLRLIRLSALIAPLMAVAGYVVLSRDFLTATIYSLAAICAALFVFYSLTGASAILFVRAGKRPARSWQFVPLVLGFVLAVLLVPIIAMLWGASVDSILDAILALKNGVQVGQARISFASVVAFGVVFLMGYFATRWLQRGVQLALFPRLRIEPGSQAAILTGVGYVGLTLSALLAVTAAGLDLTSLTVVAGALSVGIGFGLQSVVSNFVSGIILLIERPVREGDWIEVAGVSGHVRRIAFRSTHIETFDRHEVILPNSAIVSGNVVNFNYGGSEGRLQLPVGIAYDADIETARGVLLSAAKQHGHVLADPAPVVALDSLGENAINLNLLCFVDDVNRRAGIRSDLYFAVLSGLREAGIEIPFPQREVRIKQDSSLPGQG